MWNSFEKTKGKMICSGKGLSKTQWILCPVVIGSTIEKKNPIYFAGCGYVFNDENIDVIFTDSNGETLRKEQLHLGIN